jgi:hypothetical protein
MHGTGGRVALGGIAAGLVVGLAACGNAVAGQGGAPKPATGAGNGSARSAVSQINPGGPMAPPGASKHAALCAAIPSLTRMVITRTTVPSQRVHEALPGGFTIRDATTVRRTATLLCELPSMRPGVMSCPNLAGASYHIFFAAAHRSFPPVTVGLSGCRIVTGVGPVRSLATAPRIEHQLIQNFGSTRLIPPSG